MDAIQKKRIIKRFLQESSLDKDVIIGDDQLESLPKFTELANCLDLLEQKDSDLIDFTTLEASQPQWNMLVDVLNSGLKLKSGSPPVIQAIDSGVMRKQVSAIRDTLFLNRLPQPDYYNRATCFDKPTQDNVIVPLILSSQQKMLPLVKSFLPKDTNFDPANKTDIDKVIVMLKQDIKLAESQKNDPLLATLQKRLTLIEDLDKINQLAAMAIPDEPNGHTIYCTLAEAAGGVTEKVSLISLAKVSTQLGHLRDTAIASLDDYHQNRSQYKLSTEAILKLPKHGKIEEVQREAMALNVSRILGLDTTHASIMTHEGKPALFVPFDDIKLLKEFAKGKTFKANLGLSSQTYEHYATINPVGSGLQADQFVEDFGHSLALFYLCSDTDSVGGYNQNKALRNNRSLFIFDQVIMADDKLGLDTRLSLQPTEFFMKHTRHGQGRNRTLIEDSSMISKFDSLLTLIRNQEKIYKYANRTANMHDRRLKFLANKLQEPLTKEQRTAIQAEIKQVTTLKNDAMTIKASMKARIENIHKMMPVRSKTVSDIELRQSLVLEKLLNNPTLFTDTGRPYKNPWTYRHTNTIKSIEVMKDNQLLITLDNKIDPNMTAFLNRHGASIEHSSPKQLVITREKLAALRENMLHPETQLQFQADKNYLDKNDLEMISKAYDKGHRTKIMQTVDDYVKVMKKKPVTDDEKRAAINQATVSLMEHISTAKDKGFGMQVMKKLHFDIQQQLQMMIPAHQKPANLDEAFAAAIKLDRIADFNMVVNEAIHNNKLASPAFRDFLQGCIDKATLATNHQEAIDRSAEIPQMAALTVHQFKQKPAVDLMLHEDLGLIHQVDELDGIRLPVAIRLEELSDEANLLSDVAKSDVLIVEHQASPEELEKKSGEHPKDNTI